jgi:hypothetical protein
MSLRKFKQDELVLTHQEAWQVLVFFFGGNAGVVPGWLTDNDRSFAQALLIEAVDKSYAMSWMEAIFRATANPTTSVKSVLAKLALKAAKDWLSHSKPSDLKNANIYLAIRNRLTLNWKTPWQIRLDTGEPVY